MRVPRLLRCSSFAVLVALSCEKEAPKPEAQPTPPPPTPSAEAAKAAPEIPSAPPPPAPPPVLPAPADVAQAPKDAARTKTGLASKVLSKGTGKTKPGANDSVRVQYAGWTKDGQMFDASSPDKPAQFGVSNVIPGWVEGLQLMVVGEKRRLWIPAKLAYGERPMMPGAPAGDLVFDVELVEIVAGPETPKDLKQPPKDATKTASGLVYKLLTKGSGTTSPGPTSVVSVHYSGWTKDGKLFDSSVSRGAPAKFPLSNVVKGWTEGLQLMKQGDKARLWIPAALAYGEKPTHPSKPAGDLVFDVELLAIQ
jgi:FKBP-type peptidyl-prolyl cis-trans isomerase